MENKQDKYVYFNINQVAKFLDVVPATIRNWEKSGLFTAKRSGNNYRIFDIDDIEFLKKIKQYSVEENMSMSLIHKILSETRHYSPVETKLYPKEIMSDRLREIRKQDSYTLEDVSNATGISTSYLSKIEKNEANVSIDLLDKLARFYGDSSISFFNMDENSHSDIVIKNGEEAHLKTNLNGVQLFSLSAEHTPFAAVKFVVAPSCGDFISHAHNSGQEFIYILTGKMHVTLDESIHYILKPGDSIRFHSTRMHNWHNCGKTSLELIWIHSSI